MKTYTKSFTGLWIAAIMLLLSACSRNGSGCGAWGNIQHKKQYHTQIAKVNNNFVYSNRYEN